ncbi:DUF2721 domain-containing protein [Massilia forsythiae]|uniref:DUF2721 domain-containing protein n=1 Tax=Massilia forsythiae TaxID=2728020 RepID=A0A7Z2VVY1_9BURK|nr:DUF2721 domain-containing protein [Massilia forsythiae]QJD99916.1 DUF2721 domain-containing protein [Massilia forsythiae]
MNIQTNDIGHVIQLAIAPVFLLTGVATKLTVLTNRLARIIDRTRDLKLRLQQGPDRDIHEELDVLYQRWQLINYAITSSTACGFLICVIIACLFLGDTAGLPLDRYIAGMFVVAMIALIASFIFLLREVLVSFRYMRLHLHDPSGRSC